MPDLQPLEAEFKETFEAITAKFPNSCTIKVEDIYTLKGPTVTSYIQDTHYCVCERFVNLSIGPRGFVVFCYIFTPQASLQSSQSRGYLIQLLYNTISTQILLLTPDQCKITVNRSQYIGGSFIICIRIRQLDILMVR